MAQPRSHHTTTAASEPPQQPPLPGWTPERHLAAYAAGYFPMADPLEPRQDGREIGWFSPQLRAVIPLTTQHGLHIPKTAAREIRRNRFRITTDSAFPDVVAACATPRDRTDLPWINHRLTDIYNRLHRAGHAHSLECWAHDPDSRCTAIAGGIFGLSLGAVFFAESMFHRARPRNPDGSRHPLDGTNASAVALITLTQHLHALGYQLLDIQIINDHTQRFGARELTRDAFLDRLRPLVDQPDRWQPYPPDPESP